MASPFTPELRVEVAFGFGPYDEPTDDDWVDITSDAYEVSTLRGRSSEFEDFPAGTATVSIYNDQRDYDPLNTAGTHYGELLPNVPIRIVAELEGTDYPVWRGFVDGWPAEYTEAGHRAEVKVACTDAFKLLAERRMPDTFEVWLEDTFTPGLPNHWWRMDRVEDGVVRNYGTTGSDAVVVAPLNPVEGLVPVSSGALEFPEQQPPPNRLVPVARVPIVDDARDNPFYGNTYTIAAVVTFAKRDFRAIIGATLAGYTDTDDTLDLGVTIMRSGGTGISDILLWAGWDGSDFMLAGGGDITDGLPHRLVGVRDGSVVSAYVDGALVDSFDYGGGSAGSADFTGGVVDIGATDYGFDGDFGEGRPAPQVVVDEVIGWTGTAFTLADVQALDEAWMVGFGGERASGQAVTDVLDAIGWPASLRAIDAGETVVRLPANPVGTSALELLYNIARCEGGRLFVDAQGRVTFHGRSRFIDETVESAVQYTFSDVDRDQRPPPDVGIADGTLSITVDDRLTYDGAEVARLNGVPQRAGLSTTPARTYTASELVLPTDHQARSLAEWIVFRYGAAQPRSAEWQTDPEVRPADWPDVLGLDIGHRIAHNLTPGGVGSAIELEQHVALIGHDITTEQWLVTLNGSPIDPHEAAYFLWAATETADTDNGWADSDADPPGGYWG